MWRVLPISVWVEICVIMVFCGIEQLFLYESMHTFVDGCMVRHRKIIIHVPNPDSYASERSDYDEEDDVETSYRKCYVRIIKPNNSGH